MILVQLLGDEEEVWILKTFVLPKEKLCSSSDYVQ